MGAARVQPEPAECRCRVCACIPLAALVALHVHDAGKPVLNVAHGSAQEPMLAALLEGAATNGSLFTCCHTGMLARHDDHPDS